MSSLKNILLIIACIAAAGLVYYVTGPDASTAALGTSDEVRQQLIAKTQSFIERSAQLEQINIDQSFFMDSTFTSLRSFSTPVPNQPLGRENLFGDTISIGESVVIETSDE